MILLLLTTASAQSTGNCVYTGTPGPFIQCIYDEVQALETAHQVQLQGLQSQLDAAESMLLDTNVDLAAQATALAAQLEGTCDNATELDRCWDIPACVDAGHCVPHYAWVSQEVGMDIFDTLEEWDAICQQEADSVGRPGTYRAWLAFADPATAPLVRFDPYVGPYQDVNGTLIAGGMADLTDGSLLAPLNLDVNGVVRSGIAMTGIDADGTESSVDPNETCLNWTGWYGSGYVGPTATGVVGTIGALDGSWTNNGVPVVGADCAANARMYCFQQ